MALTPLSASCKCNPYAYGLPHADITHIRATLKTKEDYDDLLHAIQRSLHALCLHPGSDCRELTQLFKAALCLRDHFLASEGLYKPPSFSMS